MTDAPNQLPVAEKDAPTIKQCGWCAGFGHTTDEHNLARPNDLRPHAEHDAPRKGMWTRVSSGWQKWGPWHYVLDRVNPTTGAWRGHGIEGVCGVDLYRRHNGTSRQAERPTERVCPKCARVTPPGSRH